MYKHISSVKYYINYSIFLLYQSQLPLTPEQLLTLTDFLQFAYILPLVATYVRDYNLGDKYEFAKE